jgi:AcrR family transcriptional regulator
LALKTIPPPRDIRSFIPQRAFSGAPLAPLIPTKPAADAGLIMRAARFSARDRRALTAAARSAPFDPTDFRARVSGLIWSRQDHAEVRRRMGATGSTQPKPASRRPQQRTVDTRLKIVRSALSEFALLGFEGASTRGIAEAAGVPHSLVIYHFHSKDELWYETVKEAVRRYTRRDFGAAEPEIDGDPVRRLKRKFARYIRFSAEYPDFFRMLKHENTLASDRLAWLVTNHVGPTMDHMAELIRRAQALGAFVEGDPLGLLYLFLGSATIPYQSAREIKLLTGQSPNTEQAIRRHVELCERLFFRTPKSGSPLKEVRPLRP